MLSKVLVIDDAEDIRLLLTKYLKDAGYQVDAVSNPYDGLDLTSKKEFDLIITDLNMPFKSGFILIDELRQNMSTFKTPVLVVSARNEKYDVVRTAKAGAQDYIVKPIKKEVLLKKVQKLVNKTELKEREIKLDQVGMVDPSKVAYREDGEITALYPEGFKILSEVEYLPEHELMINSPLLASIGIEDQWARVLQIQEYDDNKLEVLCEFIGLNDQQKQNLTDLITELISKRSQAS